MRRAYPRLVLLCALLAGVAASVPAYAQHEQAPAGAPSPEAVQRADALFRSANQLYTEKKWAEAETAFLAAWALNPTYDVAANLGHAQFKLQKYRDAAEHLSFALRNWPLIGKPEPRKLAQDRLDEARRFVAAVTVRVSEPGAEVFVDGIAVGHSPMAIELFVEPGVVSVSAQRDGYTVAPQTVTVAKGERREVTLTLAPIEAKRRSVVPGAVLGGVAGAALVSGVVLLAEGALKRTDSFDLLHAIQGAHRTCVAGNVTYDARCSQLNDTALRAGVFHDTGVGLLVGAGAAAGATAAYFLWPTSTTSRPSGLRVVPTVGLSSAGVLFSGSF